MTHEGKRWPESSYFQGKSSERAACRSEAVRLAMGDTMQGTCLQRLCRASSFRRVYHTQARTPPPVVRTRARVHNCTFHCNEKKSS